MRTPFFGPSYSSKSRQLGNLSDNRLVNLYPEVVENRGATSSVGALLSTPGLSLYLNVGTGPIRALYVLPTQIPFLFIVSGNTIYSVQPNGTGGLTTPLTVGTLGSSSGPVNIIGNIVNILYQVAFFDGLNGWVWQQAFTNTPTFKMLSLPFVNIYEGPFAATYQDTFGLAAQTGSNLWYQSNPGDLTTWNALTFSSADSYPDSIVALISFHNEIWVLKQNDTEIWYDAGASNFAFTRLAGTLIEAGCAAAASVVKGGEALFWLANNPQGNAMAVMATGYNPTRISTHPLEATWQNYSTVSDALGWCYQQEGHMFYVLTFPSAGKTWVYDVTASANLGEPCWHERACLENGAMLRHWGNCFAFFNGLQILGDYRNGNVYIMDTGLPLDNGMQRKWLRSWRAMDGAEGSTDDVIKFSSLRIDMQTGIGVPDGTNPQCMLRWSDDGGYTWTAERFASVGPTGATALRVKFTQLGSTRRNHGFDRLFELSSTDVTSVSLIGAVLE